jgi:cytochrome c biogenesis protein
MSESSPSARSDQRSQACGVLELLASMRFAIALLTVICIASVIGTVLKQHEPLVNYVNQFGPFWAELFLALKLNAVYSAWWFLLILAFLVISTSLCMRAMRPSTWPTCATTRKTSASKACRLSTTRPRHAGRAAEAAAQRIGGMLARGGWKVRLQQRDTPMAPAGCWRPRPARPTRSATSPRTAPSC